MTKTHIGLYALLCHALVLLLAIRTAAQPRVDVVLSLADTNNISQCVAWPATSVDGYQVLLWNMSWYQYRQREQTNRMLVQITESTILRALHGGRIVRDVPAGYLSEQDAAAIGWHCRGVIFTKQGLPVYWHLTGVRLLKVWTDYCPAHHLILERSFPTQRVHTRMEPLVLPGKRTIRWLSRAPFEAPVPTPASPEPSADEYRVRLERFMREGIAKDITQAEPPLWRLWRFGGCALLESGQVYFFDFWDANTCYLETQEGAAGILIVPPSRGED